MGILTIKRVDVEKHLRSLQDGFYQSYDSINLELRGSLENKDYQGFLNFSVAYALYSTLDSEKELINHEFLNDSINVYLTDTILLSVNNKSIYGNLKDFNYSYDVKQVESVFRGLFYDNF